MKFSDLQGIVEDAGFDVQAYSGRGMYRKQCLSFNLDRDENLFDAILELAVSAETFAQGNSDLEFEDIILEFKGAKTDQMGLGEVVYFPNIEWEETEEYEEFDEDEDDNLDDLDEEDE